MVRQIQSRQSSITQRIRPRIQPGGEILFFSSSVCTVVVECVSPSAGVLVRCLPGKSLTFFRLEENAEGVCKLGSHLRVFPFTYTVQEVSINRDGMRGFCNFMKTGPRTGI